MRPGSSGSATPDPRRPIGKPFWRRSTACRRRAFTGLGASRSSARQTGLRLFAAIHTDTGAKQLMDDFDLHPEFPHQRLHNGLSRECLNLTMFSDDRGRPSYHRVQWSTSRPELREDARGCRSCHPHRGRVRHGEVEDQLQGVRGGGGLGPAGGVGVRDGHPVPGVHRGSGLRFRARRSPPPWDAHAEGRERASGRGRGRVTHLEGVLRPGLRPGGRSHAHLPGEWSPGAQLHLPVPGGRHPQHPPVRGRLPRRHRDRAGAELPLHPDHPGRGQRASSPTTSMRKPRRCGPRQASGELSSATTPRTSTTRVVAGR